MCTWISVKDRLPQGSDGLTPAVLFIEDDTYPLLLWDAYGDEVGEVHIGGFEDGKFYTYEEGLDDAKLNITHWARIQTPP
jgi:hypothetical protein